MEAYGASYAALFTRKRDRKMYAKYQGYNPEYSEQAPDISELKALEGWTLLEFGAPWCQHCIAASEAVEQAFRSYKSLAHIKIYDGKGKRLGRLFQVKLWPTLVLLREGKEVSRLVRPTKVSEVERLLDLITKPE